MRGRLFVAPLYGIAAAISLASAVLHTINIGKPPAGLFLVAALPSVLLFIVGLPASLMHGFRTVHDEIARAQLRWFAFGVDGALLRVVEETMQPAHVSLWLRERSTTANGRKERIEEG